METQPGNELSIEKELFRKGANIALAKKEVLQGETSALGVGSVLYGRLEEAIEIGKPVVLEKGNTTPLRRVVINETTGRIFLETRTSKYELLDKSFEGLNLDTEFGTVHLPLDSQLARLDDGIIDFKLPTHNEKDRVYINKPALKGTLLESDGAQIFNAMHGRFFVLAKVKNIHLPFYISSKGTGGKNEGEWYPFFGYTGKWTIKGHVSPTGVMSYNSEVDKVTELLNKNLKLPAKFISLKGKIGYQLVENEPTFILFDLNNHLLYKPHTFIDDKNEVRFVESITGYKPKSITDNDSPNTSHWISSILRGIN